MFYGNPGKYRHETNGISCTVVCIFCSSRRAHIDRAHFPRDMCHRIHTCVKSIVGRATALCISANRLCTMPKRIAGEPVAEPENTSRFKIVEINLNSIFDDPLIGLKKRIVFPRFSRVAQNSSGALAKQLNRNVGRRGNIYALNTTTCLVSSYSLVEWSGKRNGER